MTNSQQFFISILSDHLNGRKTSARPGLDWDALRSYAKIQQVSGIVYHQCSAWLPEEHKAQLRELHAAELFYYYNREALFRQLSQALNTAEIPFFSVKGLEVARLYPVPALRTMGDCDIVVHAEDREAVHGIMMSLGFENTQKNDYEWMYVKNDLLFEIHNQLLYDEAANTEHDRSTVASAWDYASATEQGTRYELDWSFHFLFLLLHLKKHLIHSGVGFRQFMDIAVVLQRCELNWEWINARLEELELQSFAGTILALIDRWFGAKASINLPVLEDAFCEDATEKIFTGGIFGSEDENNRDGAQMRRLANAKGPTWIARARYLRQIVFPPYRNIACVPTYAFLEGRPWLLPAAWIYRMYYTLRYKKKTVDHRIDNTFISDARLDARKQELSRWGL